MSVDHRVRVFRNNRRGDFGVSKSKVIIITYKTGSCCLPTGHGEKFS